MATVLTARRSAISGPARRAGACRGRRRCFARVLGLEVIRHDAAGKSVGFGERQFRGRQLVDEAEAQRGRCVDQVAGEQHVARSAGAGSAMTWALGATFSDQPVLALISSRLDKAYQPSGTNSCAPGSGRKMPSVVTMADGPLPAKPPRRRDSRANFSDLIFPEEERDYSSTLNAVRRAYALATQQALQRGAPAPPDQKPRHYLV